MEDIVKKPKLLISFVLDNSAQMKGESLGEIMTSFRAFAERTAEREDLEWELLTFDTFSPMVVKSFEGREVSPLPADRFPLLGRAAMAATERLEARVKALTDQGECVHRPWIFLLSGGFTMDDMEEIAAKLDGMEREGKVLHLPFKFSEKLTTERLQPLDRSKHMVEILDNGISGCFAVLDRMIEERATLAPDAGIKLSKTDFEGWAVL